MAIEMEFTDEEMTGEGVSMDFSDKEETQPSSDQKVPPRKLRRRLLDSKSPSSTEEIESKLKDADLCPKQELCDLISSGSQQMRNSEISDQERNHLSRMLARYWRTFVNTKKTTFFLYKAYEALEINEKSAKSMPFEQLALKLQSINVIQIGKALVDRLEIRVRISQEVTGIPSLENIDDLLNKVAKSKRRGKSVSPRSSKGRKAVVYSKKKVPNPVIRVPRYPVRVLLCAYLIVAQPDVAFGGNAGNELALVDAVTKLIREFESLVKMIGDGHNKITEKESVAAVPDRKTFRSQLEAFDKAWCAYLPLFAVWKVTHAKVLEEDLVNIASHLESSLIHGLSPEQVLSNAMVHPAEVFGGSSHVHSVDKNASPSGTAAVSHFSDAMFVSGNEIVVNEILHTKQDDLANSFNFNNDDDKSLKVKVRKTMEKAFWDAVMESIKQDESDFSWVIKLIKEVRDELYQISPRSLREEIVGTLDIEILTQVLKTGSLDLDYLGNILDFALVTLRKLSAPAKDAEILTTHQNLLQELQEISQSGNGLNASSALLIVKGLRFVLEQIQALKRDVILARMKMTEPLIRGPDGIDHLKTAFTTRYGPPAHASTALPLTKQWLSTVHVNAEQEWEEHTAALAPGLAPATLRTGGILPKFPVDTAPGNADELPECKGEKIDVCIRFGLLKLVTEITGLTLESLPETLKLNFSRLRNVQSQLQKIVVISTSVLVLQQTLISEKLVRSSSEMEEILSKCVQKLIHLLESVDNAGVSEIIDTMIDFSEISDHVSSPNEVQARKQVMGNMLRKSLQAGDAIYNRISAAVHLAAREAVLGGTGDKGKKLVERALKRVGAALVSDKLLKAAEVLIVVAIVSTAAHGAWYDEVLKSL